MLKFNFLDKKDKYKDLNLRILSKINSLELKGNNNVNTNNLFIYNDLNYINNLNHLNILREPFNKNSKFLNFLFKSFVLFQGQGLKHYRDSITKEFFVIAMVSLDKNQNFLYDDLITKQNVVLNILNSLYRQSHAPKNLNLQLTIKSALVTTDNLSNSLFFYDIFDSNKLTAREPILWNRRSIVMLFYRMLLNLLQEQKTLTVVRITNQWVFRSGKTLKVFLRFINLYTKNKGLYKFFRRRLFFMLRKRKFKLKKKIWYKRKFFWWNKRLVLKRKLLLSKNKGLTSKHFDSLGTSGVLKSAKLYCLKQFLYKAKLFKNTRSVDYLGLTLNNYNLFLTDAIRRSNYKFMSHNIGLLFNFKQLGIFKVWGLFYKAYMYKFYKRQFAFKNFLKFKIKRRKYYRWSKISELSLKKRGVFNKKFNNIDKGQPLSDILVSDMIFKLIEYNLFKFIFKFRHKVRIFRLNFYRQLSKDRNFIFINYFNILIKYVTWFHFINWFLETYLFYCKYNNVAKSNYKGYLLGLQLRKKTDLLLFQSGIKFLLIYHCNYLALNVVNNISTNFIVLYFLIFFKTLRKNNKFFNNNLVLLLFYNYFFKLIELLKVQSLYNKGQFNSILLMFFSKIIGSLLSFENLNKSKNNQLDVKDLLLLDQIFKLSLSSLKSF